MPLDSIPPLNLDLLLPAVGDSARWKILAQLSRGTFLASELAARIGHTPGNTSKHLAVLRHAGAVLKGRGNLYEIPAPYLSTPGQIDYGPLLLRFPAPTAPTT